MLNTILFLTMNSVSNILYFIIEKPKEIGIAITRIQGIKNKGLMRKNGLLIINLKIKK
jgi:hypothetical protein